MIWETEECVKRYSIVKIYRFRNYKKYICNRNIRMKLIEVIAKLEALASPELQENYDNSGLIVGDESADVNAALICLDSTEDVVDEAIKKNCQLIIAHHPIVFSGLKRITGKSYIERTLLKAIKNDIAIYAIHTNLDSVQNGVNNKIADKIGLKKRSILQPKNNLLKKLVVFCPNENTDDVKSAIFEAGAGNIGKYQNCSFNTSGTGSFKGNEDSDPTIGQKGQQTYVKEDRLEFVMPAYLEKKVVGALLAAHPYEEVAYDIYSISNVWQEVGSGMIGELEEAYPAKDFLKKLKEVFNASSIRYTDIHKEYIQRIALCGGSGSFLLQKAIQVKADVFITADFKYHQFFDADNKIIIADMGHYESEQFTMELIDEYLNENLSNFATYLSQVKTNPINYI